MEREDNQRQLAEIRDAVTSAGFATDLVRLLGRVVVVVGFLLLVFQPWGMARTATALIRGPLSLFGVVGFTLTLGAWASPLVAVPLAAGYRRWRRVRIRRRLAGLPREQVTAALLALRDHPFADSSRLAAELMRELAPGSEVTPAAAPEGRGDELSGSAT